MNEQPPEPRIISAVLTAKAGHWWAAEEERLKAEQEKQETQKSGVDKNGS